MPTRRMSDDSGGMPAAKVTGMRMAMALMGPIPGSIPTKVPTPTPARARTTLKG